ncbi:hypothetical protein WMY93_005770 [Mugilogobius chulae]|uniref:Uncharacterized protein n=1 Tax=Mugilogobius chulae TaxID=88201 RepID=A0AAW0PI68_9GOBI
MSFHGHLELLQLLPCQRLIPRGLHVRSINQAYTILALFRVVQERETAACDWGFRRYVVARCWHSVVRTLRRYGSWTHGVFEKMGIPGPKPLLYMGTLTKTNKVYYQADLECALQYGRVWG